MKNMELNDLIGEATAYGKKEKFKAGKPKNWCRCSKRHRERHLECHKRVRKRFDKFRGPTVNKTSSLTSLSIKARPLRTVAGWAQACLGGAEANEMSGATKMAMRTPAKPFRYIFGCEADTQ